MYKKTIKYVDYDGNEREEDFYFNLNKAELMDMDFSAEGGLAAYLTKITQEKDPPKLIEMFKKIILMSYGEKSLDGKYFRKSEEIRNNFESTEAYVSLYMELVNDSTAAAEFINKIVPKDLGVEGSDKVVSIPTQSV